MTQTFFIRLSNRLLQNLDATRPITSSQRIGVMPFPGLFTVTFSVVNCSPARINLAATNDFRATDLFLFH